MMIANDNFKVLLHSLNFQEDGNIFSKYFSAIEFTLKVDFNQQQLIYDPAYYPNEKNSEKKDNAMKIHERQTCNFSANENFVVFECVHRLLEKGYKPEHLELEPRWKVGHGASGGRADILVKDNSGKALLIIECKTAGKEFNTEWKTMLQNGGQLFTYLRQAGSTQYVCLYASDYADHAVAYQNYIITLKDNETLLGEKKDQKPLAYKDAQVVEDIFNAWKETYRQDYATRGIFEADIQPYHIGKQKFTINDLTSISNNDIQGKYHEFATILRQHNVSGRENAFDKLVNLFLCKIVDEARNPTDLKFYWKGIAYDSPFALQDRLQKLYRDGMKEFLGEDVTYIDQGDIYGAFRFFKNDPDATRDTILQYFRQLKFFTNNDFAFIEVHNERLFYQNAAVLLKIVLMLQDIRLQNGRHNQFLGDMFEGFLDQGIKQSEGQFFTPMPLTKFIVMSLPLEQIIRESVQPPNVIDYACGAGHFLNELAAQIKPFVEQSKQTPVADYYKRILGVEKEYRLSKVAKVSAFMYGQNDINIIYADALATHEQIADQSFAILVSNPPYSVKGFLTTLPEAERQRFALSRAIDSKSFPTNNAIETFFLERAQQLLQPGGVAGIFMPSSLLSNSDGTYIATRELLLQYFDIVAIVELGSGTFGKTGTNTVILFLRRKPEHPAPADHYRNRVNDWFGANNKEAIFADEILLRTYCQHIDAPFEEYRTLLRGEPSAELLACPIFAEYRASFDNLTDSKKLKSKEQFVELDKRFVEYAQRIEKDKLYYFALASPHPQALKSTQPPSVVIIKSPTDNKEQKRFLGYEWSSAKGNEGIKLMTDADGQHQTPLYDPENRQNADKLNYAIQQNFLNESVVIPDALQPYLSTARLVDMLDFSRKDFNKQISLTPKQNVSIATKWETKKLGEIADVIAGQSPESENYNESKQGLPFYQGKKDFGNIYLNEPTVWTTQITKESVKNDILISVRAPVGDVNINPFDKICIGRGLAAIRHNDMTCQKYLFEFIDQNKILFKGKQGATFESISRGDLMEIKIPLPPKDVQARIVAECEAIDAEVAQAQAVMTQAKQEIAKKVQSFYNTGIEQSEIVKISLDVQYGISEQMNTEGKGYKIFRMNEIIDRKMRDDGTMKYVDISEEEFNKFKLNKGDILFNRTNSIEHVGKTGIFLLEGDYCFASYLVRVIVNRNIANPSFVNLMMNSQSFQEEAKSKASKSINQANINATVMKNIKIPVPPLPEQERFVADVEILEQRISEAHAVIAGASARKEAALRRYLS